MKMSRWTAVPILALGLLGCSQSAQKPAAPAEKPAPSQPEKAEVPDPRYAELPKPRGENPWAPPPPSVFQLKGGQKVWRLEQGPSPLFSLHLVLPRGASSDPRDKIGLTQLTADLLDEGAGGKTALEIADALSLLATDYSVSVQQDTTLLTLNGLAENLDASLALLSLIVQKPTLSQAEFDRRRDHAVAVALSRKDEPSSRMREELSRAVFGDGYSGPHSGGTVESLKRIRLADVRAHARGLLAGQEAEFVFVGPTGEAELQALLEKHFSGFHGKSTLKTAPVAPEIAPTEVIVIPFRGAAQSALGLAKRTRGADSPDYYQELVMNERVGGSFTSRLNMVLREEKGYTYGAHSGFQRAREAGMFTIMASVHAQATGLSVQEIFRQLDRLCREPFEEQEHKEAVSGLLLGYPLRFESAGDTAAQLATLPMYGRGPEFLAQWPKKVSLVTLAEARKAAEAFCDPRSFHIVVAGDDTLVVPELEKLGLRTTLLTREGEAGAAPETPKSAGTSAH